MGTFAATAGLANLMGLGCPSRDAGGFLLGDSPEQQELLTRVSNLAIDPMALLLVHTPGALGVWPIARGLPALSSCDAAPVGITPPAAWHDHVPRPAPALAPAPRADTIKKRACTLKMDDELVDALKPVIGIMTRLRAGVLKQAEGQRMILEAMSHDFHAAQLGTL